MCLGQWREMMGNICRQPFSIMNILCSAFGRRGDSSGVENWEIVTLTRGDMVRLCSPLQQIHLEEKVNTTLVEFFTLSCPSSNQVWSLGCSLYWDFGVPMWMALIEERCMWSISKRRSLTCRSIEVKCILVFFLIRAYVYFQLVKSFSKSKFSQFASIGRNQNNRGNLLSGRFTETVMNIYLLSVVKNGWVHFIFVNT